MATNYPNGLDNLSNPSNSDLQDNSATSHANQHANANDAIEAIQAALGVLPKGGYHNVRERLDAIESKMVNPSFSSSNMPTYATRVFGSDETFDRHSGVSVFETSVSPSITSQTLWATSWSPKYTLPINYITCVTGSTAAAATPTLCRLGIYERVGSLYTLVSSIPNDTTLWAATNTAYKRQLSNPLTVYPDKLYYIGLLIVTPTTRPNMFGHYSSNNSNIFNLEPVNSFTLAAQTDLPSSFNASSTVTTSTGGRMYYYLSKT